MLLELVARVGKDLGLRCEGQEGFCWVLFGFVLLEDINFKLHWNSLKDGL